MADTEPAASPADARRMSDVEAMMWNLEKDPFLSATFGTVSLLDRPADVGRLVDRMAYVVSTVPRLRQRVVPTLGRLAPPEWSDDLELDLHYHVRHVALPAGSSLRDLYDLATLFVQDPFDRTRPLWEFLVVDGLPGGRGALVQKMHHTVTDGEGGVRMSQRLVDLTRDAEDPAPVTVAPTPPPARDLLSSSLETLGHTARRATGIAQRAASWMGGTVVDPARVVRLGQDVAETTRSAARQLLVVDRARSPLWSDKGLARHFDTLDVPFDEAKQAAKALGGTLNDLFVAGAAAGAGAYHRAQGTDVAELRMAMPVSFRQDRSEGGNAFAPLRVVVPVDGTDPVAHFEAVRQRLLTTKSERAIGLVNAAAGLVNLLPTSALVRFTRQQVEAIDFTTSNVRAAPFDLYLAGALVEGTYPLGPLVGTAFNLTMMTYRGSCNMGLHSDRSAIVAPDALRAAIEAAYADLIAAAI